MTFVVMGLGTVFNALTNRRDPASGLTPPVLNVLAIAAIPVVLVIAATQIGFLQSSLLTQPLTGPQWLACLGLALALPLVIESTKWIRRRQASAPAPFNALHAIAPARAVHQRRQENET
jgi:P-type Ca2+ transporter type 2C